ncbi:MAG: sulfatase [Halanaerobiales bacterium]|nr:sulfatase [Halanaerobiales bacterium]
MNLILVIVDSLRQDHIGAYGNKWIETPNIDQLAANSVIFDKCFPEALPTIPFRRSVYTGLRSFPFSTFQPVKGDPVRFEGWQPIPENQSTIVELLSNQDYRTALFTDTYHQFKPSMNFIRGFQQWELIRGQVVDFYRSSRKGINPELYLTKKMHGTGAERMLIQYLSNVNKINLEQDSATFPARLFMKAAQWLAENADESRFFLVVDCFSPHEPFDPPKEYWKKYNPGYKGKSIILPQYGKADYLSPAELAQMRALYAGKVTLVDHWFGYFMNKIKQLDLLDNTMIVLVSDHGVSLGERGLIGKVPWGMNRELMEIVALLYHPKLAAGKIPNYIQSHDLVATIFNLLGYEKDFFDGINLVPLLERQANNPRQYVTSILGNYVWIQNNDYMMTCRIDGKDASLYALNNDPEQQHNIIADKMKVAQELFHLILQDAGGSLPAYADVWPIESFGANWIPKYQQDFPKPKSKYEIKF